MKRRFRERKNRILFALHMLPKEYCTDEIKNNLDATRLRAKFGLREWLVDIAIFMTWFFIIWIPAYCIVIFLDLKYQIATAVSLGSTISLLFTVVFPRHMRYFRYMEMQEDAENHSIDAHEALEREAPSEKII